MQIAERVRSVSLEMKDRGTNDGEECRKDDTKEAKMTM